MGNGITGGPFLAFFSCHFRVAIFEKGLATLIASAYPAESKNHDACSETARAVPEATRPDTAFLLSLFKNTLIKNTKLPLCVVV